MNINDMFQAAEGAEDSGFADLLGPQDLPNGTEVLCEITFSKSKTRPAKGDKGPGKTFSTKLKVIEPGHPANGGEFFDSMHLSGGDVSGNLTDGQLSYNKRLFAKITATGVGATFFASNPSDEAVAKAMLGSKVRVKVQWQTPNDKGQVFLDNTTTWAPVDGGGAGGYVPSSAPVKGF